MTEISRGRAERCVTHFYGCDCREYRLQEAEWERDEAIALLREAQTVVYHKGPLDMADRIDALLARLEGK